jgi:hypothetical protein
MIKRIITRFTKNSPSLIKDSPKITMISPKIRPIKPFNNAVFDYFDNLNGENYQNTPNIEDFIEKNHQDFKKLTMENQLRILFLYIQKNSKDGLYKRPSLRVLSQYFGGVDKNTISKRLSVLVDKEYIRHMTELEIKNTYKILKTEF